MYVLFRCVKGYELGGVDIGNLVRGWFFVAFNRNLESNKTVGFQKTTYQGQKLQMELTKWDQSFWLEKY